jgi:hypothetical protein
VHKAIIITMDLEIETQIRECEARLYTAMSSSDVSDLDVLIADDLLFAGPTGELATKAMDLTCTVLAVLSFTSLCLKR